MLWVLIRVLVLNLAAAADKLVHSGRVFAFHQDVKASVSKFFRSREIANVMAISHATELKSYPITEWPLIQERHAKEIAAALNGNYPIVDRRSWAYPWLPESLHRLNVPVMKNTPYNLRRFAETPVVRHAINLIKNTVVSLRWKLEANEGIEPSPEVEQKIKIGRHCLNHPNNDDSWRTLVEAVSEDILMGGYGCIEPQLTPDYRRPFKCWSVDGSTIRIYADWSEDQPDRPRYAQMTGLRGERGMVQFLDDELIYIRDNVRTNTPWGLGCVESCFLTINAFLGVQEMSSKAGADQVHKTWLWWETGQPDGNLQQVLRHLYHEVEGQAKVSLIANMQKPEVIDVQPVSPQDLLLEWQEFLIRIIAGGFGLSAMALGLERDVNRNTSETMATSDFRNTVVPLALRVEEAINRRILHKLLGWYDIVFHYIGLDDPDSRTKVELQQRKYQMNAITPDEIRRDDGRDPLPSGLGRLTLIEATAVIQAAQSKAAAPKTPPGGMPPGFPPLGGPPSPAGAPPVAMAASGFGKNQIPAKTVAKMKPGQIKDKQELGELPEDTKELTDNMEQEEPGILQTISEELVEFFEYATKHKPDLTVKPAKVTPKDKSEQETKFSKAQKQIKRDPYDKKTWQEARAAKIRQEGELVTRRFK
jgi:hypothetical protein